MGGLSFFDHCFYFELLLQVFTVIFTVEAVIKITAYGPVTYAKNLWNDFDFIIVVISLVELLIEVAGAAGGTNGLSVLRTLRLVSFGSPLCLTLEWALFSII